MSQGLDFEHWFHDQTDGDWEHGDGVTIESLDNPGWYLRVSLAGTPLEGSVLRRVKGGGDLPTWLECWADGVTFEAACGPLGLGGALNAFGDFVRRHDEDGYRAARSSSSSEPGTP